MSTAKKEMNRNFKTESSSLFIKSFLNISSADVPIVGGKNASLGEMYRELKNRQIAVPNGFAVTSAGYRHFIESNRLGPFINNELKDLNPLDIENLRGRGKTIRQRILDSEMPNDLQSEILLAFRLLAQNQDPSFSVAIRSSATAEDLPEASFAGQQETFLNVQSEKDVLESCKRCYASLFTDRALSYRQERGFGHLQIALSIGIQMMVRSDLASSGVMFSLDTETGFQDVVLINSAYGLGENIVQGAVNPDEFYVHKSTLKNGFRPILKKSLGSKEFKMIYGTGGTKTLRNIPVPFEDRSRFSLSDEEVLTLARWACIIEDHFSQKAGHWTPMDIEWAKDGLSGQLYIVQARPETVQSQKSHEALNIYHLKASGRKLLSGHSVGSEISAGVAHIIQSPRDLEDLQEGEILVTDKTDPDWEPAMKKASGIITNRGGRTCHAAIVSRELGIPAVVGSMRATQILNNGQKITLDCAEGETGIIYDGLLDYDVDEIPLRDIPKTNTKLMMNVANPEEAFRLSMYPNDGVGLARMEFIINESIHIHPMALVNFEKLSDVAILDDIERLTFCYHHKPDYFVDRLSQGIATIAAAFYPRDVILRFSDFKSNEYANLIGGRLFEPTEENPMLGFRGASRYYHPDYREGFALECESIRKVRNEMGLTNLKVMVPFCRSPEEARKVLTEMEKNGLVRGQNSLEVYMMCEIPSNVLLAEQFARYFDGFSIGSNDLTQLTLGVDRDSEIIAELFDEKSPAVLQMISMAIQKAKSHGIKIGICGQAPSDFPDFTQFLISKSIDSISLNPDSLLKTRLLVAKVE
jgi:pyruvate,water dikinase